MIRAFSIGDSCGSSFCFGVRLSNVNSSDLFGEDVDNCRINFSFRICAII